MEMAMAALQGEAAEEAEADQVSFSKFWNNFKITGISIYYLSKFKSKPKSKNKKWWIWLSLLWRRATMLMDNLKKMENFQTSQTCYLSSIFLTFGDLWMTSRPSFLESLLFQIDLLFIFNLMYTLGIFETVLYSWNLKHDIPVDRKCVDR